MSSLKKAALFLGDLLILYLSLLLTLALRYSRAEFLFRLEDHALPFSLIFILWLFVFYLADLYRMKALQNDTALIRAMTFGILISMGLSITVFYLFGDFFRLTPKTNLLIFSILFFALDYLWRRLMLSIFTSGAFPTFFIGDSPLIQETISHLEKHPHLGYRVVSWIKKVEPDQISSLLQKIQEFKVQFVVIQPKLTKDPAVLSALYKLLPHETSIVNFSDFYEIIFEKVPLDELEEGWFIENIVTRRPFYDISKKIVDFILGIILFLILLPIMILAGLLVLLSGRPILYTQKRIGKSGQHFILYKFRTMLPGNNGPLWTEEKDARITPIGGFLRFTHLDELPQLWNILRGDISFTGPRPERVELAEQFSKFPYYEMRHVVKPGISGWAQVNYKPSASLEEAKEKLCYDIYYVKNRSFLLDLLIVLKTIRYVFTRNS